jgi:hypothetical protein
MRPYFPIVGNITQMEPTGNSLQHRVNVNFRTQNRAYWNNRFTFGGNMSYSYSWSYNDSSPVNLYDIAEDWGIANRQHRIQASGQMAIYQNSKWKNLRLNFTPNWQSGSLYSITLGRDVNGDSSTNDRPLGVGRNTETGPGRFTVNMSVSKIFYLGLGTPSTTPRANYVEPAPQFGGGGFGGGGGGFGGGGRGGGGRGNINQRGTQMTLSANITNLFNTTVLNNYSGVLTSPFFGFSNTSSGERQIRLSLQIQYR